MNNWYVILLLMVFLTAGQTAFAQVSEEDLEGFDEPPDTADFYKRLYKYSKNKKFLYFIYKGVFNPPVKKSSKKVVKKVKDELRPDIYEGRVIRKINIVVLEPFGTSLTDASRTPHSFIQKSGNALHALTNGSTIRNLLLIKKNETLDPLEITESERLLRATGYIRDARIKVFPVKGSTDSVDVEVRVQDYWSIRPYITASPTRISYRTVENNLLGLGHRLDLRFVDHLDEAIPLETEFSYRIPTIKNTYISPTFFYGSSELNNRRGLTINRPFYSPLTKFAGGLDLLSVSRSDSTRIENDTAYFQYNYHSFLVDTWLGSSWTLLDGNTDEERSTKIVTAIRYARLRYPTLKTAEMNGSYYFPSQDIYLASLSLSSRKYVRDRYIFKFGESEDVPDGRKTTITAGYENSTLDERYYFSVESALGTYLPKLGYFYLNAGYGTFFNKHQISQGHVITSIIYFTPLKKAGNWRVRTFILGNFDYGIDRKFNEKLYLNADDGLPGYKNEYPQGTSRFSLSTQVVMYTPYEFIGFRFAPIFLAGVGMVGNYNGPPLKARLYQSYGIGLLIKNEL